MKRILLIIVLGVTALVLLAVVGLGIFLATFNPNSYKGQISAAAEKATGRALRFDGDIEMTFFPALGLKTGKLTLLDPGEFGADPFLTVESASLALSLEPLLEDILAVEEVTLNGARLKLVSTTTGQNNWEYGFGKNVPGADSQASIPQAPSAGARDGVTPLEPPAPTNSTNPLQSPAILVKDAQKSFVLHVENVACTDLRVIYHDMRNGASYGAQLDNLSVNGVRPDSEIPLEASGSLKDEGGGRDATFSVKALARATSRGDVAVTINSLDLAVRGLMDAPLSLSGSCAAAWDQSEAILSVTGLKTGFSLAPKPEGTGEPLKTDLRGHALFSAAQPGRVPFLSGEISLTELNLDALLARMQSSSAPSEEAGVKGAPNLGKPTVRGKKDDSASAARKGGGEGAAGLPAVNTDLALKAEKLVTGGIPLNKVQVQVRMRDNQADIPYSLSIFDGTASGSFKADLGGKAPSVALTCEVMRLNLESATRTLSGRYTITGLLNGSVDVTGQGDTAQAVLHSLKGKVSARTSGGDIRGFKLIPSDLPNLTPIPTDFPYTLIATSASINQGIATTRDITLQSPVLTGRGGGTVRLAFSQMDLGIDFMLAGLPPAVPVTINGPFNSLSYGVDMRTFLRNVAETAVTAPEGAAGAAKGLIKGVGGLLFKK